MLSFKTDGDEFDDISLAIRRHCPGVEDAPGSRQPVRP